MLYIIFALLGVCFSLTVYREKECHDEKRKRQLSIAIAILLSIIALLVIFF